jgi:16S rRNA C967 or C1407 C5-methylase (RsmB/RsmF family)
MIARQELGSILPVVWLLEKSGLLDKYVYHGKQTVPSCRVLDMCASPGSKTMQIAELLLPLGSQPQKGRVRANDVNKSRLKALQEAVDGSGIPRINEVINYYSNVDASLFPIRPKKSETKKYDVILADVPCNGDGTCRKDIHIIPNWLPSVGIALHPIQVKILVPALHCISVGGIVSYSTCSLNPIEDEDVISAALNHIQGESPSSSMSFKLLNPTFPTDLKINPGVESWKVAYYISDLDIEEKDDSSGEEESKQVPNLKWYDSYHQEARDGGMSGVSPSMWPQANIQGLSKCFRLFPQSQDTGGFFVAFVKRIK